MADTEHRRPQLTSLVTRLLPSEATGPAMYAACGIGLLIFALFAHIIYNIYFHPLASYPGPKFAAATRVPWAHALLSGRISFWTKAIHDQYGPVVRIAPNELSYISPGSWNDVYGRRSGHIFLPKSSMFYHSPSDAYSIIAAPHDEAARIRRLLNYAFSDRALREQEPLMKVFVDLLIQRLHENAKEGKTPINMVHWYEYTTFDIIGDLAFGESFQCVESSAHHPWVRLLFSAIKASTIFQAASGFPGGLPLVKKLLAIFFSLGKNRLDHWSLTVEKVGKRLEQKSDRSDFMSYILKYNDERGMTVPEIEATSFELILAGSETTATLLAGATSLLIRHPDALRKVTEEVRTAYKTESEINMASLAHLKYLSAVLEESLRLYPPVPVGTPRVVPHPGETIEGRFVAPGTVVSTNHWATYRSSENFTDPESFHPERFLGDSRFASDRKAAFQPFSVGPRNCIGKNLAYGEMRLIMARILYNFDLEKADDLHWEDQTMFIVWQKGPLNVRLTPVAARAAAGEER